MPSQTKESVYPVINNFAPHPIFALIMMPPSRSISSRLMSTQAKPTSYAGSVLMPLNCALIPPIKQVGLLFALMILSSSFGTNGNIYLKYSADSLNIVSGLIPVPYFQAILKFYCPSSLDYKARQGFQAASI